MKRGDPVPVYVAGSSRDLERVRYWAAQVESTGYMRLTLRWFDGAEEWAGRDSRLAQEVQREVALQCLEGIRVARVFWLLWSPEPSGALYELGVATHWGRYSTNYVRRVIVSGAGSASTIFTSLADARCDSDVLGFELLEAEAKKQVWL